MIASELDDTFSGLTIQYCVKLDCGCILTELVNARRTKTCIEVSRSPTCRRSSHFTGDKYGWPQIWRAKQATTVIARPCFDSAEKLANAKSQQR